MKRAFIAFMLIVATLGTSAAGHAFFSRYADIEAKDGKVMIPISDVSDGKAHYYNLEHEGYEIKFFVVQSKDGVIRAAFDACDVCFREKKGYDQKGEFMICNNCGRPFHTSRINVVQGGCNPAPLQRAEQGEHLVISLNDIIQGKRFFPN